jgi:hypothetical protein
MKRLVNHDGLSRCSEFKETRRLVVFLIIWYRGVIKMEGEIRPHEKMGYILVEIFVPTAIEHVEVLLIWVLVCDLAIDIAIIPINHSNLE